jgi:hypothetical protein
MKVVAYLDLLGFKEYTRNDVTGALQLLENYHTIFDTKFSDGELHPASSYGADMQKFAESHLIDSFEIFLPFSDSIFIVSNDPDKFVMQLSSFLIHCFLINSDQYMNPAKKEQPTEVFAPQIGLNNAGKVEVRVIKKSWYPVLFRGGITYNDVISFEISGLFNSNRLKIPNLMGPAIVEAVGLEQGIKGPRMVISEAMYRQLSSELQYYSKPLGKEVHEILWPAYFFNGDEKCSADELFKIKRFLLPALNLKKSIKTSSVVIHYMYFVDLIIESCLKHFKRIECLDEAKQVIAEIISDEGLVAE